jgi:hypothetical protein
MKAKDGPTGGDLIDRTIRASVTHAGAIFIVNAILIDKAKEIAVRRMNLGSGIAALNRVVGIVTLGVHNIVPFEPAHPVSGMHRHHITVG